MVNYKILAACYVFLSLVVTAAAFLDGVLQYNSAGTRTGSLLDAHIRFSRQRQCNSLPLFQCNARISTKIPASSSSSDGNVDQDKGVTGVTLKMAFDSSAVWGVADLSETQSERFTSPESLDMVHRLRRESCAVLVGRGTVERDDCSLTVRRVELGAGKSQPVRVVIDPSLSLIGGDYTLLKDGLPTIIYHMQTEPLKVPISDSVTFVGLSQSDFGDGGRSLISPTQVVKDLASRGLKHIMVEGGPATARAFLEAQAVDRAIIVKAPVEFEIPAPAGMNERTLEGAGLHMIGTVMMGGDNIEYWTRSGLPWPDSELEMWP